MIDQVRVVTAAFEELAGQNVSTMRRLWRLTAWGAAAVCAVVIAVLSAPDEVSSQQPTAAPISHKIVARVPLAGAEPTAQAAKRPFDAQAETRRLAEAVRGLAADSDELKSRVAVVEHTLDDVTGSVTRDIAATTAGGVVLQRWPDNQPLEPTAPAAAAARGPGAPTPPEYGVDIGSAVSIPTLRARWAEIRSAHPQLLGGLRPVVVLTQPSRSNRLELRLVVGPLASADAAARLCSDLAPYRLSCQPTIFAGQRLAQQ